MAEHNHHPIYRPDIDGLRALAILSVVSYHAFPRYAPGGFIGVDIFFVISGYLISIILFRSLANNDFVFLEFYAHRIKRLFPALLLVTASCYIFGWFSLLPDEFKQLGKHMAAGVGFVQNIVLWQESGYFDVASEVKPLMHLWSLAVEEQFYLVYPVLIYWVWKAKFNLLTSILILSLVSFALSSKGVHEDSVKAFFAPHTRFWELMVGALLAYLHSFAVWKPAYTHWIHCGIFNRVVFREVPATEDRQALFSSILSTGGLLLIIYSIATYKSGMPYPGAKALVPVVGATLLIIAGPQAWVNRHFLSNKVAVWIGLISYPLYLWHWPLLSFARIMEAETPSRGIRIMAVIASFCLAAITYYLVEKPVRNGQTSRLKMAILCALAILIAYAGYNTYSRDGLSFRMREHLHKISMFQPIPEKNETCLNQYGDRYNQYGCLLAKAGKPTVLLLGDSHAHALYYGLHAEMKPEDNLLFLGMGGCLPHAETVRLPGVPLAAFDNESKKRCTQLNDLVLTDPALAGVKNLIIAVRDVAYISGTGFHYDETGEAAEKTAQINIASRQPGAEDMSPLEIWKAGLAKTFATYLAKGVNIIFVIDNPELGFDPKSCIDARPLSFSRNIKSVCAIPRSVYDERTHKYRAAVMSMVKTDYPSVIVLDAAAQFCDAGWCWAMKDGKMLYRDDDHLSLAGARMVAADLVKLLRESGETQQALDQ